MNFNLTPKTIGIILLSLLPFVALGGWLFWESHKPLPGQVLEDLGRDHVTIGSQPTYNSNPPTSGPHYDDWTRPGVYDAPKDDRNLIHSLEHGYIIMSYNCAYPNTSSTPLTSEAMPEDASSPASTTAGQFLPQPATGAAFLAETFKSNQCIALVDQLKGIYESKGKTKLIVVPRPSLDALVAVTAWTRLDKMNDLDRGRIEHFIDVLRDHGPERTME